VQVAIETHRTSTTTEQKVTWTDLGKRDWRKIASRALLLMPNRKIYHQHFGPAEGGEITMFG